MIDCHAWILDWYLNISTYLKFNTLGFPWMNFIPNYSVCVCVCVCVCVLVGQLCLTLCDPVYCSLAGSSVPQILQARMLEWVAIPFSGGSSHYRDQAQVSCFKRDSLPSEPHYSKYIIYIVPQRRQLEVIFDFPIYFIHI